MKKVYLRDTANHVSSPEKCKGTGAQRAAFETDGEMPGTNFGGEEDLGIA